MRLSSIVIGAIAGAVLLSPVASGDPDWAQLLKHGVDFGGDLHEMRSFRTLPSEDGEGHRVVYGDRFGRVHVLRYQDDRFVEEWVGKPLLSSIAEVLVTDIDADGALEIVAYTVEADVAIYSTDDYALEWRMRRHEYRAMATLLVANVDDDPQQEMIFIGRAKGRPPSKDPGRLPLGWVYVYDFVDELEENRSQEVLFGTDMLLADLDDDGRTELALNTGVVIDIQSLQIESRFEPCKRIAYLDLDCDVFPIWSGSPSARMG